MAVKSSTVGDSDLLNNEKQVLTHLGNSPHIIQCFGDDHSQSRHNLFLEYASGGSLSDHVKKSSGGKLPESDVRRHARSILEGLDHIHGRGFVHCDIKLQNLLVFEDGRVKIADFGLAKRTGELNTKVEIRGTPLSMAPESVNENSYEPPCDVWGLGCAVVEMFTGKSAWKSYESAAGGNMNIFSFLVRVVAGDGSPEIPEELSEEGKDFLSKCFVKDPAARWTAAQLLNHSFVVADDNDGVGGGACSTVSASPRCPFDFPEWAISPAVKESEASDLFSTACWSESSSAAERIRRLAADQKAWRSNWGDSASWILVR
ncbi:Mitogen-activated protein kinase kinase kinase 20 [Linum grandiflorum]